MSEPFLITGLPRSRTAWMSAVASLGTNSMCYHEPAQALGRWDDVIASVWATYPYRTYVGISDHGLGFHLPEIMDRVTPRTVIIERPVDEVNASLEKLGFPRTNFCVLLQEYLTFQHPQVMRVPYKSLDDTASVIKCLRWLMPNESFDRSLINHFQSMNIQCKVAKSIVHAHSRSRDVTKFVPSDVIGRLRVS